jgi:hypothetical protein
MMHKASANLLWLGAAVTLSAFAAAYVVAAFVADRLVDCTTPAVLPVAYFIMLGYAVMAAQVGIMDMVSAGRPPPYVDELQWASFVVIGLALVWVAFEYSIWLVIGFVILFFVPLGAVYLVIGMPVFAVVLRFYERAVPDLDASTAWPLTFLALAPFAVFPLHDIEARCFL